VYSFQKRKEKRGNSTGRVSLRARQMATTHPRRRQNRDFRNREKSWQAPACKRETLENSEKFNARGMECQFVLAKNNRFSVC
jgi:hypothetical protein